MTDFIDFGDMVRKIVVKMERGEMKVKYKGCSKLQRDWVAASFNSACFAEVK